MWLPNVKQNLPYLFRITSSANTYVDDTDFLLQKHITISVHFLRLKNTSNDSKMQKWKKLTLIKLPQREREDCVCSTTSCILAVSMENHIISWSGYIWCQIS